MPKLNTVAPFKQIIDVAPFLQTIEPLILWVSFYYFTITIRSLFFLCYFLWVDRLITTSRICFVEKWKCSITFNTGCVCETKQFFEVRNFYVFLYFFIDSKLRYDKYFLTFCRGRSLVCINISFKVIEAKKMFFIRGFRVKRFSLHESQHKSELYFFIKCNQYLLFACDSIFIRFLVKEKSHSSSIGSNMQL